MSEPAKKVADSGYRYFGGLASATAVTHTLKLIKVHLRTQQTNEFGMAGMNVRVFRTSAFLVYTMA